MWIACLLVSSMGFVEPIESEVRSGLRVTTFAAPQGKIRVYLPDDIAAGDTISGTVFAEPSGKTEEERKKNGDTLNGYVVDVAGSSAKPGQVLKFLVPIGACVLSLGRQSHNVPVRTTAPPPHPQFLLPNLAQAGRPLEIQGPFDGSMENTTAMLGGTPAAVLAESPRACVLNNPLMEPGPQTCEIHEGSKTASGPFQNLGLRLSAPKTNLMRGEKTNVTIAVVGLSGLSQDAYPLAIELTNLSPDVVKFDNLDRPTYATAIRATDVTDGAWSTQLPISAIRAGNFTLTGILFCVQFHQVKKNLNAEDFNALVNAIIQGYSTQISKINEEEEKAKKDGKKWPDSPEEKGRQMKRDLLVSKRNQLEGLRGTDNTDLDANKAILDKVMADVALVQLGAELVGIAADLLGYTELPLPGIGSLLKGAKLVVKSEKALKAIELAEKALEAYEKVSDAVEKAKKLKEAKDAIEEAKKATE